MPSGPLRTGRDADEPASLFVDTGAWIALQSRRDQHHAEADGLFREALRRRLPLVTTNLILAEVHRLTLFRVGVLAALLALDRIDASPSVTVRFAAAGDHVAARRWLERLAPRPVTYADAISFSVMESSGCTHVLGFDHDFEVAGFELWRSRSQS